MSPSARLEKLRAFALIPAAAVHLLSARRKRKECLDRLQRTVDSRIAPPTAHEEMIARRIGRAVTLAARMLPLPVDCVARSGAAHAWLARRGIASAALFAAKPDPVHGIEAHVWLRCGDVTIGESDDPALATFERAGP